MILRVLFALFVVFGFQTVVHAQVVTDSSADQNSELSSSAATCNCTFAPSSLQDRKLDQIRATRNSVMMGHEASAVSDVASAMNWAPQCSRFVSGDEYGSLGNQIVEELAANKYPHLMRGSDDIRSLCPGFDDMSDEAKQGFWVTVLGAMAWRESTCGANAVPHRGPYGTLVRLFQLNRGHEQEGGKWGPAGLCQKGDGETDERSLSCAMNMLDSQLQTSGKLFSEETSYWEVLHPKSRSKVYQKIQASIRSYAFCH